MLTSQIAIWLLPPMAPLLMALAGLRDEWHIPVAWSESASANSRENAENSHAILRAAGVRRIYPVSVKIALNNRGPA